MKRLIPLLLTILLFVAACGSEPPPQVKDYGKQMVIDQLKKQYPEVKDAAITQDEDKLTLATVVGASITEDRAREIGETFILLTNSFVLAEPNEELKEAGDFFSIHVGVGTGPDNIIVQGAKAKGSSVIAW